MKINSTPMSNKDIIESVGLEYTHISYEKKPRGKKSRSRSPNRPGQQHAASVEVPLDS